MTASTQLMPWHRKVAQATPATPHPERLDKKDIHGNIGKRGDRQEIERCLGIAHGGENAGGDIIEEDEGQAVDIDVQIQLRVRQDFLRGADQPQKAVTAGDTQDHQRRTYRRTENAGGVDRRLHALIVFGAKQLGHNDGTAHIAAKGKGQENQSDLVAVAHGGQGILADEFSGHQTVRNVVKLLEDDAAKQRDTELPQHLIRCTNG